ncbi:MAG: flotillin-like protein FloA [Planctomycetota bacterium]
MPALTFLLQSSRSGGDDSNWVLIVGIFLGILILLLLFIFVARFLNLWLQAYMSKASISIFDIIGMSLRKVNPQVIVRAKISAVQAKVPIETRNLESHYLAGGNVINVVRALIAADRAGLDLDFQRGSAIDLAGRDLLDAVRTSVNPKVINCSKVTAMAKDGIQVLAEAKVTVRTNIQRLVGGATEETIIARVGEGIVSTIGSSETHKDVLENPDKISKTVLAKGLDSGTAFEILSIDIADVDIGKNIGAVLQADQAEADKRIAQAKAEERRAMAVAREQEMTAEVTENQAKVVLAQAEVPLAMAEALRAGRLGVMDYLRFENLESDTKMRRGLAEGGEPEGNPKVGE